MGTPQWLPPGSSAGRGGTLHTTTKQPTLDRHRAEVKGHGAPDQWHRARSDKLQATLKIRTRTGDKP